MQSITYYMPLGQTLEFPKKNMAQIVYSVTVNSNLLSHHNRVELKRLAMEKFGVGVMVEVRNCDCVIEARYDNQIKRRFKNKRLQRNRRMGTFGDGSRWEMQEHRIHDAYLTGGEE